MRKYIVNASCMEETDGLHLEAESPEKAREIFHWHLKRNGYRDWVDSLITVNDVTENNPTTWVLGRTYHIGRYGCCDTGTM